MFIISKDSHPSFLQYVDVKHFFFSIIMTSGSNFNYFDLNFNPNSTT